MSRFLGGLLAGLVIGWVAGLLFAPQPGAETIETIGERASEIRRRAVRRSEQLCEDIVLDI